MSIDTLRLTSKKAANATKKASWGVRTTNRPGRVEHGTVEDRCIGIQSEGKISLYAEDAVDGVDSLCDGRDTTEESEEDVSVFSSRRCGTHLRLTCAALPKNKGKATSGGVAFSPQNHRLN
jgi:hypothetical protein